MNNEQFKVDCHSTPTFLSFEHYTSKHSHLDLDLNIDIKKLYYIVGCDTFRDIIAERMIIHER